PKASQRWITLYPSFCSFLIVWCSASYLVCVTSTLFPLLLTFLTLRSPFLDTHFVLLKLHFQSGFFLLRFEQCFVCRDLFLLLVRQDHASYIFEPMNTRYYRIPDTSQQFFYKINY